MVHCKPILFCLTNPFNCYVACFSSDANSDGGSRHSSVSSQASREEYVNVEDEACCPRCGKRVYFAEQVLSLGRKWHKPCFRCGELRACGRPANPDTTTPVSMALKTCEKTCKKLASQVSRHDNAD